MIDDKGTIKKALKKQKNEIKEALKKQKEEIENYYLKEEIKSRYNTLYGKQSAGLKKIIYSMAQVHFKAKIKKVYTAREARAKEHMYIMIRNIEKEIDPSEKQRKLCKEAFKKTTELLSKIIAPEQEEEVNSLIKEINQYKERELNKIDGLIDEKSQIDDNVSKSEKSAMHEYQAKTRRDNLYYGVVLLVCVGALVGLSFAIAPTAALGIGAVMVLLGITKVINFSYLYGALSEMVESSLGNAFYKTSIQAEYVLSGKIQHSLYDVAIEASQDVAKQCSQTIQALEGHLVCDLTKSAPNINHANDLSKNIPNINIPNKSSVTVGKG